MKKVLCCLVLAAMPGSSEVPEQPVPPIAIYYEFQQDAPGAVLESVKHEVGSIMSPIVPPFEWRQLASNRAGQVSEELAVVRFTGRCDVGDMLPQRMEGRSLGFTHVSDGVVLPFCEIDCSRIRAFVRAELLSLPTQAREEVFGRAVGRVLAHELYHIFGKTMHHDSAGVARSSFTARELMGTRFRLTDDASRPMRSLLSSTRQPPAVGRSLFKRACASCHGSKGEGTGRGPLLRAASRSLDFFRLAGKLGDHRSKMYHDARESGVSLPSYGESDINSLLNYLNTLQ